MAITRRQFLRRSAITAVGLNFGSPLLGRAASGASRWAAASNDKVVVTINLFGGNDGLNTVIPLDQYNRYQQLRPALALGRDILLPLQNAPDFALNPGLTALHGLYGAGKVAIVNGVGTPPDARGLFDHEAAQYEFQSGDVVHAASTSPTGWVGRYLDSVQEGAISPGIDFGGNAILLGGAQREALTVESIDRPQVQLSFDEEARFAAYVDIQNLPHTASGVGERNRQVRVTAIRQTQIAHDATAGYQPAVSYPADNYIGEQLLQAAKLIVADLGVRAIAVAADGYDTHSDQNGGAGNGQLGYHSYLLSLVSDAISAFHSDLVAHDVADRVVVVVFSEFGRRPQQNGNAGTDHGYGSVMFAVGDKVLGGVYGDYPVLQQERLVLDGNIDVTVDFRRVYATVLANFLDADPAPLLGGNFEPLGFL